MAYNFDCVVSVTFLPLDAYVLVTVEGRLRPRWVVSAGTWRSDEEMAIQPNGFEACHIIAKASNVIGNYEGRTNARLDMLSAGHTSKVSNYPGLTSSPAVTAG